MKRILGLLLLFLLLGGALLSLAYTKEENEVEEEMTIDEPLHYISHIQQAAQDHGIDPFVLAAVARVESSWQEDAESHMGARGLMQIMPETGQYLAGLRGMELSPQNLYDSRVSLDYGAYYLKYLQEKFNNWNLVFAAYNAGPGQVEQWLAEQRISEGGDMTSIPFEETRNYVEKVNYYLNYYKEMYQTFPTQID